MKILKTLLRTTPCSNSLRRLAVQNFCNPQHGCQMSHLAHQFRIDRPAYYPDRQMEMNRAREQMKSELVADKQEKKKNLPKDYYYRMLGISRKATTQQIKHAYYSLAKLYHPDISHTSKVTKRFQDISNAYHILSDETKRLEYDQLGAVREDSEMPTITMSNPPKTVGSTTVTPTTMTPMTVTHTAVNTINVKKSPPAFVMDKAVKDELIHMTTGEPRLELTFVEAAHGVKKIVDLRFMKKCPTCNGKAPRLVSNSKPEVCRKCGGSGQISKRTPTFSSIVVCDQCEGKRYTHRSNCSMCDNRGIVLEMGKVTVNVPSGVKSGDIVPVENPKTKQRINYRVHVEESDYYKRVGNDVHTTRYLNLSQALLGGICKVRGIYDEIELKIEPGTESHSQVVIKGKGIRTHDCTGDHIITIKLRIPQKLSMKQRQLIMAFAKTEEPHFELFS